MKTSFKVKLTEKEMFSFLINNTYRKPLGVILFVFGIACFVIAAVTCRTMDIMSTLLLILLGSLYTIIQPILLWRNAKRQIRKNPVYQEELLYTVDDEGIRVSQGDNSTFKKWEECWKAKDFGGIVVIYIAVNNGVVLPKKAIGGQYEDFAATVKAHLPSNLKSRKA